MKVERGSHLAPGLQGSRVDLDLNPEPLLHTDTCEPRPGDARTLHLSIYFLRIPCGLCRPVTLVGKAGMRPLQERLQVTPVANRPVTWPL
jgi:hypothetical protein